MIRRKAPAAEQPDPAATGTIGGETTVSITEGSGFVQTPPDSGPQDDTSTFEVQADEPVYDERGNVRPHGTPDARPMTFEERAAIAAERDEG